MLFTLSQAITKRADLRTSLFALSIASLGYAVYLTLLGHLKEIVTAAGAPDAHPPLDWRPGNATAASIARIFAAYGPAGRRLYVTAEAVELVFIFGWGLLLSLALSTGLSLVRSPALRVLNLAPWISAAADAGENALLASAAWGYPANLERLTPSIVVLCTLKWRLLYSLMALVAGTGAYCVYTALRMSGRNQQAAAAVRARGGTIEPVGRGGGGGGSSSTPAPGRGGGSSKKRR